MLRGTVLHSMPEEVTCSQRAARLLLGSLAWSCASLRPVVPEAAFARASAAFPMDVRACSSMKDRDVAGSHRENGTKLLLPRVQDFDAMLCNAL